jgi:hypothetical protein
MAELIIEDKSLAQIKGSVVLITGAPSLRINLFSLTLQGHAPELDSPLRSCSCLYTHMW